jgi:23S rRNA (guanine745-N1)-methyltransferase
MDERAVATLRCPHCGAQLRRRDRTLTCAAGHHFDLARQGYVNLLAAPSPHVGDDADMLDRRTATLAAGHFDPLLSALARVVETILEGSRRTRVASRPADDGSSRQRVRPVDEPYVLVDVGAGTGYQLAHLVGSDAHRVGIAVDVSKHAARRAAKAHPRVVAVVADVWTGLPVRGGMADVVLDVFAPRDGAEFARVLAPEGRVVLVTPTVDHLAELREPLGLLSVDATKADRVEAALSPHLIALETTPVRWQLELDHGAVRDLVGMGPIARHLEPNELERRIAQLPATTPVTGSVLISRHGHPPPR